MKNYKLFLIIILLVVLLLSRASSVKAITAAELQAQINALLAQITQLQSQLAEIEEETNKPTEASVESGEENP